MKPVVMFVDDDPRNLTVLERSLQTMRKKWEMVFYANPLDALNHMADGPIDLVVSDLRMPGMDGADFLGKVADCAPHTIRFALSDDSDREDALRLVGVCHQVLTKPCNTERLVQQARQALAAQKDLPDRSLQTKVARIHDLPSRPEVHELIVRELASDGASCESLAALISEDIALTAKVLQLASTGFFSADGSTPGLANAVASLGIQRIRGVVRSHSVEAECAPKLPEGFSLEELWLHSMACALVGQAIASADAQPTALVERTFVAGLVHDIGRLVMAASEPELYARTIGDIADPDSPDALNSETRIFKSTHPRIGAYLVGLWGFSEDVTHAVAYHHAPAQCPNRTLGPLAFVYAAEAFCRLPDGLSDAAATPLDDAYFQAIGVANRLADWRRVADSLTKEDRA
jgi:HD-like signal output (HDOD) protein/CheY-like chemotaxis protein